MRPGTPGKRARICSARPSKAPSRRSLAEGCAYINFTPNAGTDWGGVAELAARNRVPFYGDDGKTGETLIKTALAPMFAARNLRVLSWEGVNLLGNAQFFRTASRLFGELRAHVNAGAGDAVIACPGAQHLP